MRPMIQQNFLDPLMTNSLKAKSIICALIAALPAIALSQEQDKVTVQFVSFPKSLDTQPVELVVGEGKSIEIELPANRLSKEYEVPRMEKWVLGRSVPSPEGKTVFKSFGEAPALSAKKQLVLVIRGGVKNPDELTLLPFACDQTGFSGGDYLFVNMTKVDIAGEAGSTKFALHPKQNRLVSPEPSEEKDDRKYLYVTMYFRTQEKAKTFYTSTWRFSEKARSMVFFYHEPNNDRLKIHTIRDYLPSVSP